MGSIIERTKRDGSASYQAMVKIPGAKAAVKTFDCREMAQAFVDKIEQQREMVAKAHAHRALRTIDPTTEENRAKDAQKAWANSWLRDTMLLRFSEGAMSERASRSINAITRLAGDAMLGELDRDWVKAYLKRARKTITRSGTPYKWSSLVDHMNIISATMRWRAEELRAAGGRLPFYTSKDLPADWDVCRERRLDLSEEKAILRRFMANPQKRRRQQWIRFFRLALNTAARMQELHLAEWSEFNLESRFWTIPAAHTKKKKTRIVPLNKAAMRALRAMLLIRDPNSPKVFHAMGDTHSVSGCFYHLTMKLGLDDLRFHDLRHEAITRMVLEEKQFTVFEIMKIVGHSSLIMLERYSNLRGEELSLKLMR